MTEIAKHYKGRLADMRAERDDEEGYGPDCLTVETETVHRIVLGTGGPHDEVRIRVSAHGEVMGGSYLRIWGADRDEYPLTAEEAEEWADAFYVSDVYA